MEYVLCFSVEIFRLKDTFCCGVWDMDMGYLRWIKNLEIFHAYQSYPRLVQQGSLGPQCIQHWTLVGGRSCWGKLTFVLLPQEAPQSA